MTTVDTTYQPAWPHAYARTVGLDPWHLVSGIIRLGAYQVLDDDERTEDLAQEQPHLKREPRMGWVVHGGQERLSKYLGMGERTLRNCLRHVDRTWFPDGGFFAIWRKDRARKRQEFNAYDVEELRARVEARIAHPNLPLEEAIKLAPSDAEQPDLPLDEQEQERPAGMEQPDTAPQEIPLGSKAPPPPRGGGKDELADGELEEAAGGAATCERVRASAGESYFAPGDSDVGSEALIGVPNRVEEAGLSKAITLIRSRFSRPIPRPTAKEAVAARGLVLSQHPEQLRQVLDEGVPHEVTDRQPADRNPGGEVREPAQRAVLGEATPIRRGAALPEAAPRGAGGKSCRQEERSGSGSGSLINPYRSETTRARVSRSRRRLQQHVVQGDPKTLQKAQLIRERFPTFWRAEALTWATRHTREHIELCLRYVGIEAACRRIENTMGYLREVLRSASPSSMRRRVEAWERERRAAEQRRAEVEAWRSGRPRCETEEDRAEMERVLKLREEQNRQATTEPDTSPRSVLEVKLRPVEQSTTRVALPSELRGHEAFAAGKREAEALGVDTSGPFPLWWGEYMQRREERS